jgi:phage/plasmid-like protein (TIGR03299 family)
MAHEIFGERFLNHREPAWHGLGITLTDRRVGAVEAFRMMGEYTIRTEPLQTASGLLVDKKAIIREATHDAPEKVLGVVGSDFQPIGPMATCSIYDEAVNQPVETIGALRDGAILFVTVQLPTFDVAGDAVNDYLLVMNPMDGGEAAQIIRTPVRVVCMNTLRLGRQMGTTQYKVVHDVNAQKNLHDWLGGLYQKAVAGQAVIREALDVLANYRVDDDEVKALIESVYPFQNPGKVNAPAEVMKHRAERIEYRNDRKVTARAEVAKLFAGAGTGMDTTAARGTAWGLYNAVVEYEDCRWARDPQQAMDDTLFGKRADVKDAAFELIGEAAGLKAVGA